MGIVYTCRVIYSMGIKYTYQVIHPIGIMYTCRVHTKSIKKENKIPYHL